MKIYDKKKKEINLLPAWKEANKEEVIKNVDILSHILVPLATLLTLKYVLGYSGKEIAEITGLTETYDGNGNHLKNILVY